MQKSEAESGATEYQSDISAALFTKFEFD